MTGMDAVPGESRDAGRGVGSTQPKNVWLTNAKVALFRNFELVLVVVVMGTLLFITSFVEHKFAFLLFYFIPVLMAGFFLSPRHAVGVAILTVGFVVYLALMDPFGVQASDAPFEFWNLLIWGCFLVLTGAIVGRLQEKNVAQQRLLRDAYMGIVQILTKYLEAADVDTKSHSERVAALCTVLARGLHLPTETVQNVWSAALLHDIGKIEVIDLVRRAAELTPEERERIDTHAELGARVILTTGEILGDVVPAVLDHHRAYENGREEIHIGARIIRVADTYDAIVSDRPYRAGRFHWEAVEILQQGLGTQFDPAVVSVLKEKQDQIEAMYKNEMDLRELSAVRRSDEHVAS